MQMPNSTITVSGSEYRPCYVKGRRAIFHRWADSARPCTPRGMEEDQTTKRYQLHNVHAIVEYEDGRVARVWPTDLQFADGGLFDEIAWNPPREEPGEEAPATEENAAPDPAGLAYKKCSTCAHVFTLATNEPCLSCGVGREKWEPMTTSEPEVLYAE